jgi:hypothetical protein
MIPNPWLILGFVGALLAATAGGYVKGRSDVNARWDAARAAADSRAALARAASLEAARAQETEWNTIKSTLETQAHEREKYITGLRIANGRFLANTGGLLDKNGKPVGGNGVSCTPVTPGSSPGPATGCQLSREVSENLLELAYDADRVLNVAKTCQDWVRK